MNFDYKQTLIPLAITGIATFLLLVFRSISLRLINRWVKRTRNNIDDLILRAVSTPSLYWCLAIGIYAGVSFSDMPEKYSHFIGKTINVLVLLSITFAVANIVGIAVSGFVKDVSMPLPTTAIAFGVIKGTIIVVGFLIILNVLGVSITPLITALGVGGLAVALALQDTLANLFAGIQILMEKSFRVGDFIKLETGQEGYVEDITWRAARIRMLPNNMVIIPNSKLSQSIITNYCLPERRMSLLIPVGVSYDSDPDEIERILLEEAQKAIGEVPGLMSEPEPVVRFMPGFGESSLDFTLICQVKEYADQFLVQHELRKRIFKRFNKEKVEIPFPQRVIHVGE